MISERPCDTEDWINDAENTALHHRNKLYFTTYSNRKQFFKIAVIFHNIPVLLSFFIKNNIPKHK